MAHKLDDIPTSVFSALQDRGLTASQIKNMSAQAMFDEYCNWHGFINWGSRLWHTVVALQKLDKKEGK